MLASLTLLLPSSSQSSRILTFLQIGRLLAPPRCVAALVCSLLPCKNYLAPSAWVQANPPPAVSQSIKSLVSLLVLHLPDLQYRALAKRNALTLAQADRHCLFPCRRSIGTQSVALAKGCLTHKAHPPRSHHTEVPPHT